MIAESTTYKSVTCDHIAYGKSFRDAYNHIKELIRAIVIPTVYADYRVKCCAGYVFHFFGKSESRTNTFGGGRSYGSIGLVGSFGSGRIFVGSYSLKGYVTVIIERLFTAHETVVCNKRVGCLIGCHSIGFCACVCKHTVCLYVVGKKIIYRGLAVFDKTSIGVGIDAPHRERYDCPSTAFGGLSVAIGESTACKLGLGQPFDCFRTSLCNGRLITIGIKCGQCHAGDIHVGGLCLCRHQRPTAVIVLKRENRIYALLTNGSVRGFVMIGIKCDQRPDRAVYTLLFYPGKAVCTVSLNQVPIANRRRILADC